VADLEFVARAVVPARVALAGNPSDGYGGAVLALTIDDFCARVEARTDTAGRIRPESELVRAAVERFARTIDPAARRVAISWRTSIPRSVGLGGSSAIVIATLQALCALLWSALSPTDLAGIALAVETEDLGIAAGLQDRIAQAFGGLTFMDFARLDGDGHGVYEPLAADALPPLVVAWRPDAHEASGVVHGNLRERFTREEPVVRSSMSELAAAARAAREALRTGDHAAFRAAVDASFDARARMLELDPRHVSMIETARGCGAGANFAGSGGSIVCVCSDRTHQAELIGRLRELGAGATVPKVSAPAIAGRA
jgi:galactokinase/mevalonate kinase-like predicted kinase